MSGADTEPRSLRPLGWKADVADVPSTEWGWSGENFPAFRVAGFVVALFLLALTIGNHESRIEDLYLVGLAVGIVGFIGIDWMRRRRKG